MNIEEAMKCMIDHKISFSKRTAIARTYIDFGKKVDPFVIVDHKYDLYKSGHEAIVSLGFESESEVKLANSMYEAIRDKGNFNINEFIQQLKFTMRILQIDSEWAK